MSNRVRATHSDWNGSTIEVKEQSRRSNDFSTRVRAAIALGGLEKTYTVSCRTTIIALIQLEIEILTAVCRILCPWLIS